VIDRLEKAGYVERDKDPSDRRRVIVRPLSERIERDIAPLYASLGKAWERAIERYSTEELAVILDILTRSVVLLQEQTAAPRHSEAPGAAPTDRPRSAARSGAGQLDQPACLLFTHGIYKTTLTLRGAALPELYQAR
jgi:hypothetical protein